MTDQKQKELPPQERYREKLFTGSSHSWALEKLKELSAQSLVLDIGPGTGVMGRLLREQGVTLCDAVEIDEQAREFVKPFYRTTVKSLSELELQQYDYVLLLDVLEHMPYPDQFLQELDPFLKPGGQILISVPNIAHWSIRFSLLFGRFNYKHRGILDKTHFRFFTRSSLKEMLCLRQDLSIKEQDATIEPLELILPIWLTKQYLFQLCSRIRLAMARFIPGLMAFQHLARVHKRKQ